MFAKVIDGELHRICSIFLKCFHQNRTEHAKSHYECGFTRVIESFAFKCIKLIGTEQ